MTAKTELFKIDFNYDIVIQQALSTASVIYVR